MPPVRFAIIGCGGYSGAHALRLNEHPDAEVVALCDVSEEIARGYLERNLHDCDPPPRIFTDRAHMYEEARPDAVFVVTPHTLHFEHCMEALDHGCHVFVEKPMVTRAEHAYELKARVEEVDRILVIGYNTPCTPEFLFLREQIRNSTMGPLELVSGHLMQAWKHPTAGSWRQNPELSGGGQAYDSGAHLLNSLCWSIESNVAEVHAFVDNQEVPVDINTSINIRFENGVYGNVVVGGNCTTNDGYLMFAFEQGLIKVDGWGGTWMEVYQGNERIKYPPVKGRRQWPDDNFIDAILGRAEPRTTPFNGLVQSELMDAIYESARTGQPARPKAKGG